ncbi:calponin homology domain-containing protein DDB_G0272472-like [Procambarus clarkii]|uniref:calponin homology domain-containing protein DDB_G0272472-like n=1 Tax=Procambarus clarkii TaxID=6728 RepID=UPI0037442788
MAGIDNKINPLLTSSGTTVLRVKECASPNIWASKQKLSERIIKNGKNSGEGGGAATFRETQKINKYRDLELCYRFMPIGSENLGTWGKCALKFLRSIDDLTIGGWKHHSNADPVVLEFLNKEDCLARLKYLGKQKFVLVSAYLEIKIHESDSSVENLSKVHKHLKAGEKQESEAQSVKESEIASTEKEDKVSDSESDAGELNISFLTVKMRTLEINREIEWKKLEIEREMKEKEIAKEIALKEKEMEMKRLELEREREREEREREERRERDERARQEKEKERLHELEVLRLGGRKETKETSSFDPVRNIKMVPKFNEKEDSKFFAAFKKIESIPTDSADSSPDEKHGATATGATEQEEKPYVQAPTDTQESGAMAHKYLRYGEVQCSRNRLEIPQTSESKKGSERLTPPRVNAECGFDIIRNVGRPDGGRANTIFNVQAALLGLGVGLVSGYALSTDLKTIAVTPNHLSHVFLISVSLKDCQTGTRNACCDQPPVVPRHREVSIHPIAYDLRVFLVPDSPIKARLQTGHPRRINPLEFLNKEDCLARLKYLGKQKFVLVSAYLEIKIHESDSSVEILSKVHKHLKAGEKQKSETQSVKESEIASTEKEDKVSDSESDAGELNISFLTVKMRTLEINREIEWKKLEIEREMKEKEIAKEIALKEKEMEMKRLELEREREREEREREERRERDERARQEKEKERLQELEVLRLGGRKETKETSSFDPVRNIKMVPKFNEKEDSKFFAAFKKVAASLNWPKENWAIMIQSDLTGKAQIAYST